MRNWRKKTEAGRSGNEKSLQYQYDTVTDITLLASKSKLAYKSD